MSYLGPVSGTSWDISKNERGVIAEIRKYSYFAIEVRFFVTISSSRGVEIALFAHVEKVSTSKSNYSELFIWETTYLDTKLKKALFLSNASSYGAPGTHWIGGWVDPRAGLEDVEKRKFMTLLGLELRPLGRSARSQSLYRLHSSGS
jgi:hypothetical protein